MPNQGFFVSNGVSGTLSAYEFEDGDSLQTSLVSRVDGLDAVGALAVHPSGSTVYAATRTVPPEILTFAVSHDHSLCQIGQMTVEHEAIYLATDKGGEYLFAASYRTGHRYVMALHPESGLAQPARGMEFVANKAHAAVPSPTSPTLVVTSLFDDCVVSQNYNEATGDVEGEAFCTLVKSGSGPRHACFSNDGERFFVLNELTASIDLFSVHKEGSLRKLGESCSIAPENSRLSPGRPRVAGSVQALGNASATDFWAADIRIAPDGRFLFATERTASLITVLSYDRERDRLCCVGHHNTERQPRSIAVSSDGKALISLGEKSAHFSVFRITGDGQLHLGFQQEVEVGATWVEFSRL
jgi:6-phosphogluconolactonase